MAEISISIITSIITNIGASAFARCNSLTSITVNEKNVNYKSIDGNLYSKDGKTLIQYAIGKTDATFLVLEDVIAIGADAFADCSSLTEIKIVEIDYENEKNKIVGVESIGAGAFENCSKLSIVKILNKITKIEANTFAGCTSLTTIDLSSELTTIKASAFYNCISLKTIIITKSVVRIEANAFAGCDGLKIYCEIKKESIPSGWDKNWSSNCSVSWEYKGTN